MSDAAGSFVPVLAKRSRWGRAPSLRSRRQRSDEKKRQYSAYVVCPIAIPSRFRRSSGTDPATAASQRLMKIEATEPTPAGRPASTRRSMPRVYASAQARYCGAEKRSVTFTGTPAKMVSSIARSPSVVPGILMKRLGRMPRPWSLAASSAVAVAS
jgi:hypothetical protein